MRREEKFPDQKCLNISSLQTDYLNLDNSVSGSSAYFVDLITIQRKMFQKDQTKKGEILVFHLTEIRNVRLGNAIDVDLKIT